MESIDRGSLPPNLCLGLITSIPKPRKDPLSLDNWQPISLLKNDYKVITLLLANRLKLILDPIIDECQEEFMQKRH